MFTHRISHEAVLRDANPRDSIGGHAVLPADMPCPKCECGEGMVLFLQLDVAAEFGLPLQAGSHLAVFMCRVHNDAPEQFEGHQLPPDFWDRRRRIDGTLRFYQAVLFKPETPQRVYSPEPNIGARQLKFDRVAEDAEGLSDFKLGGRPHWLQSPTFHACSCGATMHLLCQIPADYPFRKADDAVAQPDSFSKEDYCLFLGNAVYLLACEAQCSPFALHPVVQN